jgi:hypothetical protein
LNRSRLKSNGLERQTPANLHGKWSTTIGKAASQAQCGDGLYVTSAIDRPNLESLGIPDS